MLLYLLSGFYPINTPYTSTKMGTKSNRYFKVHFKTDTASYFVDVKVLWNPRRAYSTFLYCLVKIKDSLG
jgi:hypothetical protein